MSRQPDDPRRALVLEVQATLRGLHAAVDTLSQTIADKLGVNRTDLRCIQTLGQFGPQTAGQLATAAQLSTGALTSVIDRLEKVGYVRRVRDDVDRRRVYVELTPIAAQLMERIFHDLPINSALTMAGYSDESLVLIRDFVHQGRGVVLDHVERVKAMSIAPGAAVEAD